MEFLIGADPEVFVKKNGHFVCAHDLVPGTKADPHKVDKGAVQVDGMALEFNIDPAKNLDEFKHNINAVMAQLADMVPEYQLVPEATAQFSKEVFKEAPKEAKILGCEPDFNAWEQGEVNTKPNGKVTFRTGAGHIHIGWGKNLPIEHEEHLEACHWVVQQLDASVGMFSVLYDTDTKRRELYGKAGAYRPKSYGVEYRVLSNVWLKDPVIMELVYKMVIAALEDLSNGKRYSNMLDWGVVQTLNVSDKHRAKDNLKSLLRRGDMLKINKVIAEICEHGFL